MTENSTEVAKYDVGGVLLDRPFKVQRLGHMAFGIDDMAAALHFYCDLLGMNISDSVDFAAMFGRATPDRDGNAYFLHVASDHHSTVLFPRWTMPPRDFAEGTEYLSHLAWQVGTMEEVLQGGAWLTERFKSVRPGSRDPAGANYNTTVFDNLGIPNEIYYGMDQIGWSGCSKPPALWSEDDLPLPPVGGSIAPDFPVVRASIEAGKVDPREGLHRRPWPSGEYVVDGVRLPRPFRVIRNSPVALFTPDVAETAAFYRDGMGMTLTEEVEFEGERCQFLRTNTEHHALVLLPIALRERLGLHGSSLAAWYGLQVQNYRQLRQAIDFLQKAGIEIRTLPPALTPGIDYCALAMAPDGHAILLYYRMDQIGWDGRAAPSAPREELAPEQWPETVEARPDSYCGFIFQGPIG